MAADDESTAAYPIRSVDRVCDILDTLANSQADATLTEVAEATGLPKSSAFRYLSALENRHYVERDPQTANYRLGPAFRPQHGHGVARLAELARPILEQLRDRTGETTNLGILDGTSVVHEVVCDSHQMIRLAARIGERGMVHSTALGKAMCSLLPANRVQSIVSASGMPRLTPSTLTTLPALLEDLDRVREQGYALDDGENQQDGRCVAVPIAGLAFLAGISVSAPAFRFSAAEVPAVAKLLRRGAKTLARQMLS